MYSLNNKQFLLSLMIGDFIWANIAMIFSLFFVAFVFMVFQGGTFRASLYKIGIYVSIFGIVCDVLFIVSGINKFMNMTFIVDFLACLLYFLYFKKNGTHNKKLFKI